MHNNDDLSTLQTPKYCIVYVTCPKEGPDAEKITKILLEEKLASCVSTIPDLNSSYSWQGKVMHSPEKLLVIKTKIALLPNLTTKILAIHPYTCPEILAMPIIFGTKDYLTWMESCLA